MTTLLETITAAVHGDEREMVREDARRVILAARECLDDGGGLYASSHVAAVEAVIANLLPTCTERARQCPLTMAVVAHARALIDGTHVSHSYPARRRLRILVYPAHRLLVTSQTTLRLRLRWRRRRTSFLLAPAGGRPPGGTRPAPPPLGARRAGRPATPCPEAGRPAATTLHIPTA